MYIFDGAGPGSMKQICAVMADVHGNRGALEAVLEDIDRRGIDIILNLGDSLYGPLDPAGTADLLIERNILSVGGNEDRILIEPDAEPASSPSLQATRQALNAGHLNWLREQPSQATPDRDIYMCHGSPGHDMDYLLWDIGPGGAVARDRVALDRLLDRIPQSLILCGHDHVPCTRRLPSGKTVVNPGSVGLPAYTDDHPHRHKMEAGSPHTRYAVITRRTLGWEVEQVVLTYDWDAASATARQNGRPDWAAWLKTGKTESS